MPLGRITASWPSSTPGTSASNLSSASSATIFAAPSPPKPPAACGCRRWPSAWPALFCSSPPRPSFPKMSSPINSSRVLTLGAPLSFPLVTAASLLSQADWGYPHSLAGPHRRRKLHPLPHPSPTANTPSTAPSLPASTGSSRPPPPGAFVGASLSILLAIVLHIYCERPTVRLLNRRFGGKRKSTEFPTTP